MKSVIIVGVGALGSHVIQFLRSVPDCALGAIDCDRVERKNTLAQFHGKASVGKSKVLSIQQTMSFLFGCKLDVIPHRLVSDNVEALLGRGDLLIDCLDNAEARRLLQRHARDRGVPCLHGALAADGAFGRVIWDEHFHIDAEPETGAATCEGGEHLPFIAVTAAHLAHCAQRYLLRGEKVGMTISPGGAIIV